MEDSYSQILLDCLHQSSESISAQRLESLSDEDWEQLLKASQKQRMLGLLYHRLKLRGFESVIPAQYLLRLKMAYLENAARNLKIQSELGEIISALRLKDIPCLVLKGLHLAAAFYENHALREMADIDLMVPGAFLRQATDVLNTLGYRTKNSYDHSSEWQKVSHHLPIFSRPSSTPVEVHWSIVHPDFRQGLDIDLRGLWERSLLVHIGNFDASVLCTEDILLHLCSHACDHHRFEQGLRPVVDIAQILASRNNIIWSDLIARSRESGVHRSLYLLLRLTKELTGTHVPPQVLSDLRPANFNELLISEARELILADMHKHRSITPSLTKWRDLGLPGRLAAFFRRIFLPKIKIADMYDVSPQSMKLYRYYFVRSKDLLARYCGTALKLDQHDEELTSIARCKSNLDNYLTGT